MFKRFSCVIGFFIAGASIPSRASVEPTPITIKTVAIAVYEKIKAGTISVLSAAKRHPFLTVGLVIVLLSKKTQLTLKKLPNNVWDTIQTHPIIMGLLGGLLINYILS
jgi:hypothetical protein